MQLFSFDMNAAHPGFRQPGERVSRKGTRVQILPSPPALVGGESLPLAAYGGMMVSPT